MRRATTDIEGIPTSWYEQGEGPVVVLVLANCVSYDSWPVPAVKVLAALGPLTSRLPDTAIRSGLGGIMARGHDTIELARDAMRVHWPHYREHGAATALVRQARSLDVEDTRSIVDRLPDLDLPAAVVWGDADRFQTIDYGERLASDLSAPLHRIPGGRHFVPEDHPDGVATAIQGVLRAA